MKIENYNSKAKEAFGKSLVDVGIAIFKSLILLVTVVPITIIFKLSLDKKENKFLITDIFEHMTAMTFLTLLFFVIAAFFLGHYFRSQGLKYIHESYK